MARGPGRRNRVRAHMAPRHTISWRSRMDRTGRCRPAPPAPHHCIHRLRRDRPRAGGRSAFPRRNRSHATRRARALLRRSPATQLGSGRSLVKAHVDARAVADDPVLRVHAAGNEAAYAAAKAAALRHPAWDPTAQAELATTIERITSTLRVAAHILPRWRPANAFHYQRDPIGTPIHLPTAVALARAWTHIWDAAARHILQLDPEPSAALDRAAPPRSPSCD